MIRFLARGLLFSFMALLLASCESNNDSVDVPGISAFSLTLTVDNPTVGQPDDLTSAAAPLTITALVTGPGTVGPIPGVPVSFTLTGNSGAVLSASIARTNSLGLATVTLFAGSSGLGAGTVVASYTDPDLNITAQTSAFRTQGDGGGTGGGGGGGSTTNVLAVALSAVDAGGATISATNPVTTNDPGRLRVLVTLDGIPQSGVLVTFTAPATASLSQSTAATDGTGFAEVTINATDNGAGVASVTATMTDVGGTAQERSASVVIVTAVVAPTTTVLKLGSIGAAYSDGIIATSATAPIALGSTITVSADVVVDPANTPYTTPVTVQFTSTCAAAGTATIDAAAVTANGRATVTYKPTSCATQDTITASLVDGTRTLTASGTVSIQAPTVAEVAFVSVNPASGDIALAGTGGISRPSRADVRFRVASTTGSPVPNQTVCFSLSTTAGGITVTPSTTTNSNGEAVASVNAGSVPTSVRVLATVDSDTDCSVLPSGAFSTVSSALYISTGLPDQNSFSLSFSSLNPLGWEVDGTEVTVTARAADHFNNPVPSGTAISFWTELGSIDSACLTDDTGACSVKWRSQELRSNRDSRAGSNDRLGRSTVLAYAVGEESFTDANGNGRFDAGEPFADMAEALKDGNENGIREAIVIAGYQSPEEFVDFDADGVMDAANGRYDGVLCATVGPACSGDATSNVRRSGVVVMSSRVPRMYVFSPGQLTAPVLAGITYDGATDIGAILGLPAQLTDIGLVSGRRTVQFLVTDINGNALPVGATITATVSPSGAGTVSSATPAKSMPSQTEYYIGNFTVDLPDPLSAVDGELIINVTAGGVTTQAVAIPIDNL